MKIIIDPHAATRAEERGATHQEIIDTVNSDTIIPAKENRLAKEKTYIYEQDWNGKSYTHKKVRVIYIIENSTIVVITVVVKYGTFKL